MYSRVQTLLMALAAAVVLSCDVLPTGPFGIVTDSVHVVAAVLPDTVAAGDSTALRVEYRNQTDEPVVLSYVGCPFYLDIVDRDSGAEVSMRGRRPACPLVERYLEVPAGDTVVHVEPIVAEVCGLPAPSGMYIARLRFTIGSLGELEAPFVVE